MVRVVMQTFARLVSATPFTAGILNSACKVPLETVVGKGAAEGGHLQSSGAL